MKGSRVPNLLRNQIDKSITLWFGRPKYSLLWLHGIGDEAQTFVPFFSHLQSPLFQGCRVKLLQAPQRFMTLNQEVGNAWFDLKSSNRFANTQDQVYQLSQLTQTANSIAAHVQEEQLYWSTVEHKDLIPPSHRVFVGGFSQGAVAALHYALTTSNIPAGVISASGYLLKTTKITNLAKLPILLMHGEKDTVVKEGQAKTTYSQILENEGLVEYQPFKSLGHEMKLQQLLAMRKWLDQSFQYIQKHYEQENKMA